MSGERILMPKSLAFAKRIVFAYRYLSEEKKEYVLSKQSCAAAPALALISQRLSTEAAGRTS